MKEVVLTDLQDTSSNADNLIKEEFPVDELDISNIIEKEVILEDITDVSLDENIVIKEELTVSGSPQHEQFVIKDDALVEEPEYKV